MALTHFEWREIVQHVFLNESEFDQTTIEY